MPDLEHTSNKKIGASLRVYTLGTFAVEREDGWINAKDWGRDTALQLFQYLLTVRHQLAVHKEQIIEGIWGEDDFKSGEQNFKVAQHGMNKALEPDRKRRSDPKYIMRQGITYQLALDDIWTDADAFEAYIEYGNRVVNTETGEAVAAYRSALQLYKGSYLPSRLYEDWSSAERERLQVLALDTYIHLAELLLASNPHESIRLCQQALLIENSWEDAYRIQMEAYRRNGNRPMVIKTFQQLRKILKEEFGVSPLPETQAVYDAIIQV